MLRLFALFLLVTTLASLGEWKARRALPSERLGVANPEDLSPAHHVSKDTPPTLIMHGSKDTTVPIATVEVFEKQMKKLKRPWKLVSCEGAGHGFFNRGEHLKLTTKEAEAFLVKLGWLK